MYNGGLYSAVVISNHPVGPYAATVRDATAQWSSPLASGNGFETAELAPNLSFIVV